MKKEKRLTPKFDTISTSDLQDLMSLLCSNLETSLRQNGAVAGRDYTHLDLMKLAAPFALERFKSTKLLHLNVCDKDTGLWQPIQLAQ